MHFILAIIIIFALHIGKLQFYIPDIYFFLQDTQVFLPVFYNTDSLVFCSGLCEILFFFSWLWCQHFSFFTLHTSLTAAVFWSTKSAVCFCCPENTGKCSLVIGFTTVAQRGQWLQSHMNNYEQGKNYKGNYRLTFNEGHPWSPGAFLPLMFNFKDI